MNGQTPEMYSLIIRGFPLRIGEGKAQTSGPAGKAGQKE